MKKKCWFINFDGATDFDVVVTKSLNTQEFTDRSLSVKASLSLSCID
jgi:hypothetical protein